MAAPRMSGKVIRLVMDKGFGFIRGEDGQEHFFHRSAVADNAFESMQMGDTVTFIATKGPKGTRAEQVTCDEPTT